MTESTPAAKTEAFAGETIFSHDGNEYIVPPANDWSLDSLEAYEDGRMVTFLRELMGAEQWAKFKEKPRKAKDVEELSNALMEATGSPNG